MFRKIKALLAEVLRVFLRYLEEDPYQKALEEPKNSFFDPFIGPLSYKIPKGREEVEKVYGVPGTAADDKPDLEWERENMTLVHHEALPLGKLYVHKKVAPYLLEAVDRTNKHSPGWLKRIGCFNFRKIKGTDRLSYHSYGIAVDLNHHANGRVAGPMEPFRDPWDRTYHHPDAITPEIVKIWEACGWSWGGYWRSPDPMHFELVKG